MAGLDRLLPRRSRRSSTTPSRELTPTTSETVGTRARGGLFLSPPAPGRTRTPAWYQFLRHDLLRGRASWSQELGALSRARAGRRTLCINRQTTDLNAADTAATALTLSRDVVSRPSLQADETVRCDAFTTDFGPRATPRVRQPETRFCRVHSRNRSRGRRRATISGPSALDLTRGSRESSSSLDHVDDMLGRTILVKRRSASSDSAPEGLTMMAIHIIRAPE